MAATELSSIVNSGYEFPNLWRRMPLCSEERAELLSTEGNPDSGKRMWSERWLLRSVGTATGEPLILTSEGRAGSAV